MNSLNNKKWPEIWNKYKAKIMEKLDDKRVRGYLKLSVIPAVVIVGIIVIAVTGNSNKQSPLGDTGSGDVITIAENLGTDSNAMSSGADVYGLKKNAFPEVNRVIEAYFKAISDCDVDALSKIVDTLEEGSPEEIKKKLEKEKEYIEGYENIECYTKDGLEDNSYIVYVYYELKFVNIDTLAPGLVRLYVTKDEDGTATIYNGSFEGELSAYVDEVAKEADVLALSEEVEEKQKKALVSDSKLEAFYNKLVEGAGDLSTQEESSSSKESTAPETTSTAN